MKIVELKQNVFKENEITADGIREELKAKGILMINVMSSPGSGKTTTLVRIIEKLQPRFKIGVMECDIDSAVDAETIIKAGAKAVQLHTGGMCHMDAAMTKQGLDELEVDGLDIIFIENVGNLVCPAEFDTGAHKNLTILSVPEGDDKPAKYPLVYEVSEVTIINKIDVAEVFDFDFNLAKKRILSCNPNEKIFEVSAKNDCGFEPLENYILDLVQGLKS